MTKRITELRGLLKAFEQIEQFQTSAAYRIARNLKALREHIHRADADEKEWLEKLCDKDENGEFVLYEAENGEKQIRVTNQDNVQELMRILKEINEEEVEVKIFPVYSDEIDGLKISPAVIGLLLDIIEER